MRGSQYIKIDFIKEKDERVFKIIYSAERLSGDLESWAKANYLFLDLIRKQFLIFRTLSSDIKKQYLQKLEENFSQKK